MTVMLDVNELPEADKNHASFPGTISSKAWAYFKYGAAICDIYQLLEKQIISTFVEYCIPCISNPLKKKNTLGC